MNSTSLVKIPGFKSITVSVHPVIWKFLVKKSLIDLIQERMSLYFCQVNMERHDVLLSPDKALMSQRQINNWSTNTLVAFNEIISEYSAFEWPMSIDLWRKTGRDISTMIGDLVYVDMDATKGILTLAGMAQDVSCLKPIIGGVLSANRTMCETCRVTEEIAMPSVKYRLLYQIGFKSLITPEMCVYYRTDLKQLQLSGSKLNCLLFKNWVLEKQLLMKHLLLKMDSSILEFMRIVDCGEMSTDLFLSQGIPVVYSVENEDVILIGFSEQALSDAETRLNEVLGSTDITIEDQGVLTLPEWQNFKESLEKAFRTLKKTLYIDDSKHKDKITVAGFKVQGMEACERLKRFFLEHAQIEEELHLKSIAVVEFLRDGKSPDWENLINSNEVKVSFDQMKPCIKLSGKRVSVEPALSVFKTLTDALCTDTLVIKMSGIKDFVGGNMLSMFLNEKRFTVALQEEAMLKYGVYTMRAGPLTLEVSHGDINEEKTDAIVNVLNEYNSADTGGEQAKEELCELVEFGWRKAIIHVRGSSTPAEIKKTVLSVLKVCETHKFVSVAFPALGTGRVKANPAVVAHEMVSAVVLFVKTEAAAHLKGVKFITLQPMLGYFQLSVLEQNGKKIKRKRHGLSGILKKANREFELVSEEIQRVVFQLCGNTQEDLSRAITRINSLIKQDHMELTICDPVIKHFTPQDAKALKAIEMEFKLSIQIDKIGPESIIVLKGLTMFIHTAEIRVRDVIRQVERNENRKMLASMNSNIVEWQFLSTEVQFKAFDSSTNYDLEEALKLQQTSVKIKIMDKEYSVSLTNINELVATRGKKKIALKRVDLKAPVVQSILPSNWKNMEGNAVVVEKLSQESQEFINVENKFNDSASFKIISIERIQNSTLWNNYSNLKKHMEFKNKHQNNERHLFHGTCAKTAHQINHHGFNRSYAGKHGVMFGNGTYFAVNPNYSVLLGFTKPDFKGHKCIYLARVLVGEFTQGHAGLLAPPKKSSNATDLYDSVTNFINNPTMFVIFHDVQAYPEYLITFI